MKKTLFLFLLLPLWSLAQNKTTVSVQFTSATSDSCSITVQQYFIDEYEPVYKAAIKDNRCSFTLQADKPMFAKLFYANQRVLIYLEPGTEMSLNIGTDSLDKAITFTGGASAENNFLKEFYSNFKNDFDKEAVKQTILNTTIDKFEIGLYNARKKQREFFNNYNGKDKLNEVFRNYITNTIKYNYTASLLSYPIVTANQSAQILTVNPVPELMLEGIDSKLCNDDALSCDSYREFLFYYIVYFTSKTNSFNKFRDANVSMESKMRTASQNLSGRSLVYYMANFLNTECNNVAPFTVKQQYTSLSEKENKNVYTLLLKKKCEVRMNAKVVADKSANSKTETGATASTSNYPKLKDLDGKYFTIDDLKGKVVYVDFWASWCGPCRAEMPASKQLHEMFTAKQLKNLVFLYISIDASEDAWKGAVKQIGMEGKLGISPGNWGSEIAEYFQINSIPRYMLINKQGTITDTNAKRPSSGQEIYNDISKLLEE